jgi:uracil-DNA glycosylase
MLKVGNDWDNILIREFSKPYFSKLWDFVEDEYRLRTIYPKKENIFNAFRLTPYKDVKIVILGQDPYHNCGQAEGLAFSVPDECPVPPSLINIFKEMKSDLGVEPPCSGSLRKWTERGVLLLNTVLTVQDGLANSHKDAGWETFSDNIIKTLSNRPDPIVFILWGSYARSKKELINTERHYVIESAHPSPLSASAGFFGSKPFSKANRFLGKNAVDWRL